MGSLGEAEGSFVVVCFSGEGVLLKVPVVGENLMSGSKSSCRNGDFADRVVDDWQNGSGSSSMSETPKGSCVVDTTSLATRSS